MTTDEQTAAPKDDSLHLIEMRLRDRAAALSAEGRDQLAELVRAWADLHALRRRD